MKRIAFCIIITIVGLFLCFSLIPISHATRSHKSNASLNIDLSSNRGGFDLKHVSTFTPADLVGSKRAQSPTPVSGRAVNFAVSEPVRNLPDAKNVLKNQSTNSEEGREKNELNGLEIKSLNPSAATKGSIDSALQGAKPIESETPSVPSLTFDGLSDADTAGLTGSAIAPSDENIDVGPNDVLQTVNDGFRIWDKNGNPKIAPKLISSLFSNLGGMCAHSDNGDPVVLYDRMADRWFITQFAFASHTVPPFHQCVAVSRTSDPQGIYFTYDFITPGANFPDYGKFGVWPDGYYMTVNQFINGGPFNGVGAYALDRTKMLVGDPTASFIYFDMNVTSFPEGFNSTLPSDQDGLEAPPPGAPNVFAYLLSDEFESAPLNIDSLRLFNFHADFSTPANSTFTERPESPVPVAAYDPRNPPGRSEVKEPPPAIGTDSLDSIAYHLMHRLQYRNRGGIETLVSSTTVNVSGVNPTSLALYQTGVRYFELQRFTPSGPFLLYDNATFSPDAGNPATGVNRWLPSAAIDHMGNLAVSYSASSTSVFPSIWYAGRDFNALGGLTGETHMFDGTAVQLGSSNRWGDYQSLQVDPLDDCTFWTTNQYYSTNSSFNWRTRIGKFKFPTCQAPAQGTLSGTITACDSGLPISGAIVQLSSGFSATTKADGTYSINVAPGTYSATVTNGARDCLSSTPATISVTNGSTTSLNSCLNGTANPIVDPLNSNPATISGGNGNGIIDSDECNTLNVTIKNLGCAPANSVTATLSSSTSGVTIAQANSPYPSMPIDGTGTNTMPFSVSTAPDFVCGTTVNFTLTVTFAGGTSVSTFSLPTCTEVLPDQIVSGSIDPADAKSTAGRIGRNGIQSVCGTAKACPGALGAGGRSFDQLSFTNPGTQAACVTITLSSAGGANLIGSAYRNSYDPTDTTFCMNYLGDPGGSANGNVSWKVDVPAGGTFVVVVMEVNSGTPSTPYSVTVSGLRAAPVSGGGVCQPMQFSSPTFTVSEAGGAASLVVTRSGLTTGAATVDYATSDGTAKQKTDYTIQLGTLQFAAGETSKTLEIPIVDDNFVEGNETFTVILSNPTGTNALLGSNSTSVVTIADNDIISPTTNPIDDAQFFVRQQYLDFLNRQPDAPGFAFWTNEITSCGSNAACIDAKRIGVSAAFFLSIEFQETGGFAIRTQRAAFGRKSFDPSTRFSYLEFVRAQSQLRHDVIIGQPGAELTLEANKQAYDLQIVNSASFIAMYAPGLSAGEFVDALFTSAGVTPTVAERSSAIIAFGGGGSAGRAAALRLVTDCGSMRTADFSPQFVLIQYYGYLRRNPTDPPDTDDSGYQFWLTKLNSVGGDFGRAEMVKAFITSAEYRARFGP